ncbi:hypothetical protein NQ318_002736, partial [Aromia moschata]
GFVRDFDIETVSKTLRLHQKLEGDVSCVVWDTSIVLAKYLEKMCEKRHDRLENLNVLELGAGVGCVGLTAVCLGANVLLTDLSEVLPSLKLNVHSNKSNWHNGKGCADVAPLVWGQDLEIEPRPDLIVLADCVYYKKSVDLLIKTLRGAGVELRDTDKQKECWEYFLESVRHDFNLYDVPLNEQDAEYCSADIVLMKLNKTIQTYTKL